MRFEEEFRELAAWYRQKCDEYDKVDREAFLAGKYKGLDSELGALHSEDRREYNRRLILLKVKYGKELSEGEKEFYERVKEQPSRYDDSKGWEREPLPLE